MALSHEINIRAFRQILFLPLTLSPAADDEGSVSEAVAKVAGSLTQGAAPEWQERGDLLAYLDSADDPYAYAEFVYFHPYIQTFLYNQSRDRAPRAMRLFCRSEPGAFDIDFIVNGDRVSMRLPIERLHLYLFELGVAILVVEVDAGECPTVRAKDGRDIALTLAHILALQNALRRIYPPYFDPERNLATKPPEPLPEYPAALRWSQAPALRPIGHRTWIRWVKRRRVNPLDRVWLRILRPLNVETRKDDRSRRWRQIIDERLPSMAFLAVDHPCEIGRGDFVRLCFVDGPGEGDFPRSESYLEDFERKYCYDAFWHYGTRYMFSGYSMIAFGQGNPDNPNDFFCHTIGRNFRRHYFQMGLLIQFQFAALLAFSHRVSEATRLKPEKGDDWFRAELQLIEEDFLTFEQRYWFTQISNQMQAREMYDLWLERTGVRKIYEEVRDQVRAANDFLDARAQQRQVAAAERLSIVATYGVVAGLAIGALGMNVLASSDFLASFGVPKDAAPFDRAPFDRAHAALLFSHLAVFAAVLGLAMGFARWALDAHRPAAATARKGQEDGTTARLKKHDPCLFQFHGKILLGALEMPGAKVD